MVATHQKFVLVEWYRNAIEMVPLNQSAFFDIIQTCATDGLADIFEVGGHQQFYGIINRSLTGIFFGLTLGQQLAHGNNRKDTNGEAEKTGDGSG